MTTILDHYFELSDLAADDAAAFDQLIGLFAEDATVKPNGAPPVQGRSAIAAFFGTFFRRNTVLRHVWTVDDTSGALVAHWAVAGQRNSGEVFALAGTDTARLDSAGRIVFLEVTVKNG